MPLERKFEITPARDCHDKCAFDSPNCAPDKGGYHGIHGANFRMYLVGEQGAVQFVIFTNWYAESTKKRLEDTFDPHSRYLSVGQSASLIFGPMPADIGYHKRVSPDYEKTDWDFLTECCDLLDGAPCLYDGSGLNAERVFEILVTQGLDAVWTYLEQYYAEIFIPENSV